MFQVKIVCSNWQKEIENEQEFIAKLLNPYQDGMIRIRKLLNKMVIKKV